MESAANQQTQALQTAFKMFDRDGDGQISAAEFKVVMGSLVEKLSDADADKMFKEADKDGDGAINFEEFSAMLVPTEHKPLVTGKIVGEKKLGETQLLRNALLRPDEDLVKDFRGMHTLKEIFLKNAKELADKPFLGSRAKNVGENGAVTYGEYQWKSFKQVHESAHGFGAYLMKNELCPRVSNEEGTFRFVALYAKNREEWVTADLGSMLTGTTVVTLYDTLGHESIDYILMQCDMKTVICSADKIKTLSDLRGQGKISTTTHVIHFDEAKQADVEAAQVAGLTVISFAQAVEQGKALGDDGSQWDEVTPDTFYTFSYTSGTTGMPKGVMLTHRNYVCNAGALDFYKDKDRYEATDVYFSYLPLAHVFERLILITAMAVGMYVGFYQGDVLKLTQDLAVLKPTVMVSVPRLFNRFYDLMQAKIKELQGMKRQLTEWGIAKKLATLTQTAKTQDSFYDAIVFNKFREILGGRVRTMITGSAPISKDVLNFLKIAFCCQIKEGYGQTESAAAVAITWTHDPEAGTVGSPFPSCEIKLVDVPDMHYKSDDLDHDGHPAPRGEICYRGYNVFKGYYRQPELTKETLDSEGFVHTGDIGQFDVKKGTLKIIDRKKNIFKLSQGEYIVPEKIENKLAHSHIIGQIFVYGDSLQHFLVAIVVPDRPVLEKWCAENGVAFEGDQGYAELLQSPRINKLYLDEMVHKAREAGLFGFEIPQKAHITQVAFTPDNDILTPTFKLKRNEAKRYFYNEIKSLYNGAKLQGEE